ncbi:uncharacterized protein METZ01_LOCUS362021, partial [marine metagenome]
FVRIQNTSSDKGNVEHVFRQAAGE